MEGIELCKATVTIFPLLKLYIFVVTDVHIEGILTCYYHVYVVLGW